MQRPDKPFFAGNVSQDFSNLDGLDLDDTLELLESTQDSLDEIWKQEDHKPYSEARMKHLLDVMAGALGRYVQRKLAALDIWHDSFQQVSPKSLQDVCHMNLVYWPYLPRVSCSSSGRASHGLFNLEKALNLTSLIEKSLNLVKVLEKDLISLLGLEKPLKFTTLSMPDSIFFKITLFCRGKFGSSLV